MRIEIWADVVCGWAYIGKRRLERALALAGRVDAEVVWRPYRIDPTAPERALALDEVLRDPLVDDALRACAPGLTPAENRVRVSEIAAAEGIGPRWGARWHVSSHDAHRLLALAHELRGARAQDVVAEGLLHAHFVAGHDIGDASVLARLAVRAGLDADVLDGDHGHAAVRDLLLEGRARGITTSPTLVVGERALAGAQPPDVIAEFLRDAPPDRVLPPEVRRMRWAESLLDQRDPLGALTLLRPLLDAFGDDRAVRLLAARAYFASAQLSCARVALEPYVDAYPDDAYARLLLARTLERQGDHSAATPHRRLADATG